MGDVFVSQVVNTVSTSVTLPGMDDETSTDPLKTTCTPEAPSFWGVYVGAVVVSSVEQGEGELSEALAAWAR